MTNVDNGQGFYPSEEYHNDFGNWPFDDLPGDGETVQAEPTAPAPIEYKVMTDDHEELQRKSEAFGRVRVETDLRKSGRAQ